MDIDDLMTRMQKNKADFLLGTGCGYVAITVYLKKEDGSTAKIDPFGRVEWTDKSDFPSINQLNQ